MRSFIALVRREVLEHQGLVWGPVVFGALMLGAMVWLLSPFSSATGSEVLMAPALIAFFTPFVAVIAAVLYLLDSLAGERRDRSVVFFRSLPVSDTKAILAKLTAGLTVVPAVCYLTFLLTGLIALATLLVLDVPLRGPDGPLGAPAGRSDIGTMFQLFAVSLYWNLAGVVWFAPFAGYALLVSALFRRATYLFALAPLGLVPIENLVFGKSWIWQYLYDSIAAFGRVISGGRPLIPQRGIVPLRPDGSGAFTAANPIELIDPAVLLAEPSFWIGLVFTAACIVAAIQLRRISDDGSA